MQKYQLSQLRYYAKGLLHTKCKKCLFHMHSEKLAEFQWRGSQMAARTEEWEYRGQLKTVHIVTIRLINRYDGIRQLASISLY